MDIFNGYGKSAGLMQAAERGEIESPIYLTSTLNVGRVWDAALSVALERNPKAISISPIVLECNDGMLSDARGRHVREGHVRETLVAAGDEGRAPLRAAAGPRKGKPSSCALPATAPACAPALGSVGAGSGMKCMGRKGGIGSSSRIVKTRSMGEFVLGAMSLNNFGGTLQWRGREISPRGDNHVVASQTTPTTAPATGAPDPIGGSCIIVLATSAPLDPCILRRIARRVWAGVARVGSSWPPRTPPRRASGTACWRPAISPLLTAKPLPACGRKSCLPPRGKKAEHPS